MYADAIKTKLRAYYNREAEYRNSGEKQDWKIRQREAFYKLTILENKKTLLEIGAGTGQDSRYFMDHGLKVLAIDLSGEMVRICKEKNIEAYEFDMYDLFAINRKFDCVWSMNSLLHIPKSDLKKVLIGIESVLNENGLFYMGVYGGEDSEGYWTNDISETPRFFSYYSESKIKEVLQSVFEIMAFTQFDVGRNIEFQSIIMRRTIGSK